MTYSAPEFLFYEQCASTNDQMKTLLNTEELAENSVVITAHQTTGRGQVGNKWESEANKNLTFSLLLRPGFLAPHLQFYISKCVSLGLVDLLKEHCNDQVSIKWPNDIYVGDKKICGILIENSILGTQLDYCVVGIGLNINQETFKSDAPNPVSLKQICGKTFELDTLLEQLLDHIEQRYHQLEISRFGLIDQYYQENLYRKDGFFDFKDKDGAFKAYIGQVNEMGLLTLIDTEGKKREYAFKEVEFLI